MVKLFYNTIEAKPEEVHKYEITNYKQEERVLFFFQDNPGKEYTPMEVWLRVFRKEKVPLTSVRRAMSNLTKRGFLEKTEIQRMGVFGKYNYCWRLKQQRILFL